MSIPRLNASRRHDLPAILEPTMTHLFRDPHFLWTTFSGFGDLDMSGRHSMKVSHLLELSNGNVINGITGIVFTLPDHRLLAVLFDDGCFSNSCMRPYAGCKPFVRSRCFCIPVGLKRVFDKFPKTFVVDLITVTPLQGEFLFVCILGHYYT